MINQVALTGHLTRDVDLRYTQGGTAVGSFTLAVQRSFTNKDGQREADFINCIIWRKSAENLSNFVHKGSLLGVQGRMQTRSYDNKDGQRVFITEVVVENFALLEPRSANQHREQAPATPQQVQNGTTQQQTGNYTQQTQNATTSTQTTNASNPFNNPDPFANSSKQIDISDDDLPF
jgi:single-strand DNA-binding protein